MCIIISHDFVDESFIETCYLSTETIAQIHFLINTIFQRMYYNRHMSWPDWSSDATRFIFHTVNSL